MLKNLLLALMLWSILLFQGTAFAKGTQAVKLQEGFLLAAFGTSVPEAKIAFKKVEATFRDKFKTNPIVWTYTSQIIRKKLAKEGESILGISEALDYLAKSGVQVVRVQPLHVLAGEEFTALERALLIYLQKHPKSFAQVYLGRPLLENEADAKNVAKALLKANSKELSEGVALVLMGHGQEKGRAGLAFEGVRSVFKDCNANIYMATVEGQRDFKSLLTELKANKVKRVLLRPLMVVAGDHARNDLSGSEADSWASRLKKNGFEVLVSLEGLGELPEVSAIYIQHALESEDDLTKEPKKP